MRRRLALAVLVASALTGAGWGLAVGLAPAATSRAASDAAAGAVVSDAGTAAPAWGDLSFNPMLGLPASDVDLIGASPSEASGEVWAQGQVGGVPATVDGQTLQDQQALLRYTDAQGDWQIVPLDDASGNAIPFTWVASESTMAGGLALIGAPPASGQSNGQPAADTQTLVTRDPGGAFTAAAAPSSSGASPVLDPGEQLYSTSGGSEPLIAAFADGSGHTGAFVVPTAPAAGYTAPAGPGVLELDQGTWTREPVCATYTSGSAGAGSGTCAPPPAGYQPLAIAAASTGSAWLLASTTAQPLMLFQRQVESDGTRAWVAVAPNTFLLNSSVAPPSGETVKALASGPLLTATTQGVWVDAGLAGITAGSATVLVSAAGTATAAGSLTANAIATYCYAAAPATPQSVCGAGAGNLGGPLTGAYTSVAWPGASPNDPGERVIAGAVSSASSDGALLVLSSGASGFTYTPAVGVGVAGSGPGGVALSSSGGGGGAAFASPSDGWLGVGDSTDGAQVVQVSSTAASDALTSWPLPFGQPLLAVANQPGTSPGDPSAQALAVGVGGEVAWYKPGEGWQPDYLYSGSGARETPTLRGVAWPTAGRAYAVGDDGAMWLWQSTTDLWEPDPAEPPSLNANFTAIAFDPNNPDVGYAVGGQGTLLAYGKTWTQVPSCASTTPVDTQPCLPAAVADANFTSIAFAGNEAIVGYEQTIPNDSGLLEGGLLVNKGDGSGWQIDQGAAQLLAGEQTQQGHDGGSYTDDAIFKVASVPGGDGAVAAGPGVVIETNDAAADDWTFSPQPLPEAANVAALSAFAGPGGQTQALVSIDTDVADGSPESSLLWQDTDNPPNNPTLGSAPVHLAPDPLPDSGYLLRQTAGGWQDLERDDYPVSGDGAGPIQPDAVLALDVSAGATAGWALGGYTGTWVETYGGASAQSQTQTAGADWLGSGNPPPSSDTAAIAAPAGQVSFALGGDAACAGACADYANVGIGPDVWTTTALQSASRIGGLRAFLWTGDRISVGGALPPDELTQDLDRYGQLLQSGGSSLPVYAALSPAEAGAGATPAEFQSALGAATVPLGQALPLPGSLAPTSGTAAYAFQSTGTGGTVDVIVLDYSGSTLDAAGSESGPESSAGCTTTTSDADQLDWLCNQLAVAANAGQPAIVLGSENVSQSGASNYAADAADVDLALTTPGASASAYLFDAPEQNLQQTIGSPGGESIPAYGSGTLGYVDPDYGGTNLAQEFLGASGYLMLSVNVAQRDPGSNVAPVSATLIPNVGSLSIDATDGTLLRRSQVALFDGLARIPLAGLGEVQGSPGEVIEAAPQSYIPIPETCEGSDCNQFIAPDYTFTSSNPDIGDFVEPNPDSTDPDAVYEDSSGDPVADSHSGLFCAYNAGTTTVTVATGGFSYSEQVTVQSGSVEQPCGTVPLTNPPVLAAVPAPPNLPATAGPAKVTAHPTALRIPHATAAKRTPTPKPTPKPTPAPKPAAQPAPRPTPQVVLIRPVVPPAAPANVRPTPPSGTAEVQAQAPVSQNVGIAQEQRQDEHATQIVHHMAAYDPDQPGNAIPPLWPLGLALCAAVIAAGLIRSSRDPKLVRAHLADPDRRPRR